MNRREFLEKITAEVARVANDEDKGHRMMYGAYHIGIRFENKPREVGEICENSKHNADRADERDFPEYGTSEYEEMEELGGASAWNIDTLIIDSDDIETVKKAVSNVYAINRPSCAYNADDDDYTDQFITKHCYLVGGKYIANTSDMDDGEVIIEEAEVLAIIY